MTTYTVKDRAIVPYKVIRAIKDNLEGLMDGTIGNLEIFGLITENLPLVRVLLRLNFEGLTNEAINDLDIVSDIVPMLQEIIQAVAQELGRKEDSSYLVHEYNEEFSAILGAYTTERYRVSLGIVEDVMTTVSEIQKSGKIDTAKISEILEDVEDGLLKSFPTMTSDTLDRLDAIEIFALYKKYFTLGLYLLAKKNGTSQNMTVQSQR